MKRFHQIRAPKTASRYVRNVLTGENLAVTQGYRPVTSGKKEGNFYIGTIRNPFSWLRSWYNHSSLPGQGVSWRDAVLAATETGKDSFDNSKVATTTMPSWEGTGLCTSTFMYYYGIEGSWAVDYLVDSEQAQQGLELLLKKDLSRYPPFGVGSYSRHELAYDEELIMRVFRADHKIFSDFGYGYGGTAKKPLFTIRNGRVR